MQPSCDLSTTGNGSGSGSGNNNCEMQSTVVQEDDNNNNNNNFYYYHHQEHQPIDTHLSLEETIAQEERWIHLYQVELVLIAKEDNKSIQKEHFKNETTEDNILAMIFSSIHKESYTSELETTFTTTNANNLPQRNALDWIWQLTNQEPTSQDLLTSVIHQQELEDISDDTFQQLQPLLRNFCFTQVQHEMDQHPSPPRTKDDPTSTTTNTTPNTTIASPVTFVENKERHHSYTFHGYFLANRSVHAVIRFKLILDTTPIAHASMDMNYYTDKNTNSNNVTPITETNSKSSTNHRLRIDNIHCSLVDCPSYPDPGHSTHNKTNKNSVDWSWLEQQVTDVVRAASCGTTTHYIAQWITFVSEFLEFDQYRRSCLDDYNTENNTSEDQFVCDCPKQVSFQHANSKTTIRIPIYPKQNRQYQQQSLHRGILRLTTKKKYKPESVNDIGVDTGVVEERKPENEIVAPIPQEQQQQRLPVQKPSNVLTIVWSWRWNERRACLRLLNINHDNTSNNNVNHPIPKPVFALRQPDLDQLVHVCHNDCWQTIQLLITHCSGCECWRRPSLLKPQISVEDTLHDADDEGDTNNDDDDDDDDDDDQNSSHSDRSRNSSDDDNDSIHSTMAKNQSKDSSSPFRYSPSGRYRSDYEVQRLKRIQRNEIVLHNLGLIHHNPNLDQSDKTTSGTSTTNTKKRKRKLVGLPDDLQSMQSLHGVLELQRTRPQRSLKATTLHRFAPAIVEQNVVTRPIPRMLEQLEKSQNASSDSDNDITKQRPTVNTLKMAAAGNNSRYNSFDDYLPPKSLSLQNHDGTYPRPRGRSPANYEWDSKRGVWKYHNDCTYPTKILPMVRNDLAIPQPKGRPRRNHAWDSIRGMWRQQTSSITSECVPIVASSLAIQNRVYESTAHLQHPAVNKIDKCTLTKPTNGNQSVVFDTDRDKLQHERGTKEHDVTINDR